MRVGIVFDGTFLLICTSGTSIFHYSWTLFSQKDVKMTHGWDLKCDFTKDSVSPTMCSMNIYIFSHQSTELSIICFIQATFTLWHRLQAVPLRCARILYGIIWPACLKAKILWAVFSMKIFVRETSRERAMAQVGLKAKILFKKC